MQIKLQYLILILTLFSSFWFWKILNYNTPIAVFLLIITFALFTLLVSKKSKALLIITIVLFNFFTLFLIKSDFDKSLFSKTLEEKNILNQRRSYYPRAIGQIFQNKVNLSIHRYIENFFDNLDPNTYFFAGHPRERSGISEFEKFYPLLIFSLLIRIFWGINIGSKVLLAFSLGAAVLSGFFNSNPYLGSVLFFPLICVLISQGTITIITIITGLKHKNES